MRFSKILSKSYQDILQDHIKFFPSCYQDLTVLFHLTIVCCTHKNANVAGVGLELFKGIPSTSLSSSVRYVQKGILENI